MAYEFFKAGICVEKPPVLFVERHMITVTQRLLFLNIVVQLLNMLLTFNLKTNSFGVFLAIELGRIDQIC